MSQWYSTPGKKESVALQYQRCTVTHMSLLHSLQSFYIGIRSVMIHNKQKKTQSGLQRSVFAVGGLQYPNKLELPWEQHGEVSNAPINCLNS